MFGEGFGHAGEDVLVLGRLVSLCFYKRRGYFYLYMRNKEESWMGRREENVTYSILRGIASWIFDVVGCDFRWTLIKRR